MLFYGREEGEKERGKESEGERGFFFFKPGAFSAEEDAPQVSFLALRILRLAFLHRLPSLPAASANLSQFL